MNRIFAITAASEHVTVGGDGRGEITFTVTNSSARPLRGQLRVRPLGQTKGEWLSVAGETERAFSPNATQQVVVKVATPPGAPAGKYQFRLDAVSVINPDDDFTEGPTVDLEVKPTEAPKKAFPWWIIAAAAGAVILVVGLTWWLWPSSGTKVVYEDNTETTPNDKTKLPETVQVNRAAPAVASWDKGRLDIFGVGLDKAMYHKAWANAWYPSTGWEPHGGGFTGQLAVESWGINRLDIFGVGLDKAMYHKSFENIWQQVAWEHLGGQFSSQPVVASWGGRRLDIFGLGSDQVIWHKAWDNVWLPSQSAWESLGGQFISAPAVASWGPGRLDIFSVGLNKAMYHKAWA
ncbi:MAG TPA: hypothetical protein VJZ77_16270, partial [Blastocatellia bacterium]|nr:hypothetical protein [Blastocatellia bacterium]